MTTTPFLGCKISLISKSEIRYEGILYTIDPKESTIALAKVRSYGTEDRPAERQVPPREEIFEYIIFRAGDIKDLIVDDPPTSIAPGLADPAIIQAHSTSTSSAATFPSTTFPQMTSGISANSGQRSTGPAFSSGTNAINSLSGALTAQSKTSASTESRSRNSTPTNVPQHRHSPSNWTHDSAQVSTTRQTPNKENQRRNTGERAPQQYDRNRRGGGGGPGSGHQNFNQNHSMNRRGSGGPPNRDYRQGQNDYRYPHNHPQSGNRFGGSQTYNQRFNSYSGDFRRPQSRPQYQRGSQNRMSNRPAKEPLKFESDFDFDKAQEDFKEIEEKMSNLKVDGQSTDKTVEGESKPSESKVADGSTNGDKDAADSDHFYDKAKSFFDTISCEAIEREKGNVQRIDWKQERKMNSETFGVPLSYRRFGYGRGRGGYRGYSGFRSRGGFGRGGGAGDGRRFNGQQNRSRN